MQSGKRDAHREIGGEKKNTRSRDSAVRPKICQREPPPSTPHARHASAPDALSRSARVVRPRPPPWRRPPASLPPSAPPLRTPTPIAPAPITPPAHSSPHQLPPDSWGVLAVLFFGRCRSGPYLCFLMGSVCGPFILDLCLPLHYFSSCLALVASSPVHGWIRPCSFSVHRGWCSSRCDSRPHASQPRCSFLIHATCMPAMSLTFNVSFAGLI